MRPGILLIFTLFCTSVICQFTENFDDGNITNGPIWQGNVAHFIVNAEGSLQLQASSAGESILYTQASFPDSFIFEIKHTLDFSPSASNLSRIYFLLDQSDLSKANGYYFNLGENGSTDAIRLYELTNGTSNLLASGPSGAIALNSNPIHLRMEYASDKKLIVTADIGETGNFIPQFEITRSLRFTPTPLLLFQCIYTASRTDKFTFDDISITAYAPDTSPPTLSSASINEDGNQITLVFSEKLNGSDIRASNFKIAPADVSVSNAAFQSGAENIVVLTLNQAIQSNKDYRVEVVSISDTRGNTSNNIISNPLRIFAKPVQGTILLSEILFDPVSGGSDFLEIYNSSEEPINLKGLVVRNESNNTSKTIETDLIIAANGYLALSPDPNEVAAQYKAPAGAEIKFFELPAFNNADGHSSIYYPEDILLDEFAYDEDFHNPLIDDTEGVSLERLSFGSPFGDGNYGSAAASVFYATPGYQNSNFLNGTAIGDEPFSLVSKRLSPDGDGLEDELLIVYKLPEAGFLLNLKIYDANGQLIKTLANNELLGTSGFIKWNGANEDGMVERVGVYILKGTYHSLNGSTAQINKTCILASKL